MKTVRTYVRTYVAVWEHCRQKMQCLRSFLPDFYDKEMTRRANLIPFEIRMNPNSQPYMTEVYWKLYRNYGVEWMNEFTYGIRYHFIQHYEKLLWFKITNYNWIIKRISKIELIEELNEEITLFRTSKMLPIIAGEYRIISQ